MIASVVFRRFKALRSTQLSLAPFNLVVGPNGSGKTSLIQAVLQLRTLARLPLAESAPSARDRGGPEITFVFDDEGATTISMHCREHARCDALELVHGDVAQWPGLQQKLGSVRTYLLDHYAMATPARRTEEGVLQLTITCTVAYPQRARLHFGTLLGEPIGLT